MLIDARLIFLPQIDATLRISGWMMKIVYFCVGLLYDSKRKMNNEYGFDSLFGSYIADHD